MCDGGILVIGAGDISYKFARKSKEQLEMTGCKLLGCVLKKLIWQEILIMVSTMANIMASTMDMRIIISY